MKIHISFVLGFLVTMGVMTSCLDEVEQTCYYYDYCTVTGSFDKGYVIYSDMGDELHPDLTSVYNFCGRKLDNVRRAYLQFTYKQKDCAEKADGGKVIYNMGMTYGSKLDCRTPLELSNAESLGVTNPDSIWEFTLGNFWVLNGFLNVTWKGYYSYDDSGDAIFPTIELVYDKNKMNADTLKFTMYYNRHDSINAPNYYLSDEQVNSYGIAELVSSLPASDSIVVSVKTPKGTSRAAKVVRSAIKYPY